MAVKEFFDPERERLNSLLYWYPKIGDLGIPTPKTIAVVIDDVALFDTIGGEKPLPKETAERFLASARKIGFPLFMKTANFSSKHSWKDTCYVESEDKLMGNMMRIVEDNFCLMPAPSMEAIVFREYIPMDTKFTAYYGEFPVGRERRYFINKGRVLCRHAYWPVDSIRMPSIENWEAVLKELNTETEDEVRLLTSYAGRVAKALDGFWSVDFCKAKDGRWILIDAAIGERSWHPQDCPYNGTPELDLCTGAGTKPGYDWEKDIVGKPEKIEGRKRPKPVFDWATDSDKIKWEGKDADDVAP